MAANKRTKTEREEALAETARLDRRGYSIRDIARMLKVTHQQVAYDLKVLRKRYAQPQKEDTLAGRAEKIDQYREVRSEAWEAWERSKQDKERRVAETVTTPVDGEGQGGGTRTKAVKHIEGRLPEHDYLNVVLKCLSAERELLGLDPPKKMALTNPEGDREYDGGRSDTNDLLDRLLAVLAEGTAAGDAGGVAGADAGAPGNGAGPAAAAAVDAATGTADDGLSQPGG